MLKRVTKSLLPLNSRIPRLRGGRWAPLAHYAGRGLLSGPECCPPPADLPLLFWGSGRTQGLARARPALGHGVGSDVSRGGWHRLRQDRTRDQEQTAILGWPAGAGCGHGAQEAPGQADVVPAQQGGSGRRSPSSDLTSQTSTSPPAPRWVPPPWARQDLPPRSAARWSLPRQRRRAARGAPCVFPRKLLDRAPLRAEQSERAKGWGTGPQQEGGTGCPGTPL